MPTLVQLWTFTIFMISVYNKGNRGSKHRFTYPFVFYICTVVRIYSSINIISVTRVLTRIHYFGIF